MTNVFPGIQETIEINRQPRFSSSSQVILNQLFETLSSLDIESDSNNELNTLRMEIKVLIKEMLPYSTVTIPWQYYNALTSKLAYFLKQLNNSQIEQSTINDLNKYIKALSDLGTEYKNQPKGNLIVEWPGIWMTMYMNRWNTFKQAA